MLNNNGIRFSVTPGMPAASKLLYGFPPDYEEMRFWQQVLRPGDLFVDVGANVGVYSLWAASLGANVVAYEPSSDSWDALLLNIRLNDWEVSAQKKAVGAANGVVAITVGRDSMNSCTPESMSQSDWRGLERVPLIALDSEFKDQQINGLKIDVEGYEGEVLQGARELLEAGRVDYVQFEWNGLTTLDLPSYLRDFGYFLFRPGESPGHRVYHGDVPFGEDVFAVRSEQLLAADVDDDAPDT